MQEDDFRQGINTRKNDLINKLLILLNVLIVVAVAGSLMRYAEIGWHYVMSLHIVIAVIATTLTACRNRVSYLYKAWIIIALFFMAALGGLLTFGMAGGNLAIWVAMPIYAAALLSFRVAVRLICFSIVILISVAWLSVNGLILADVDYDKVARSSSTWTSVILSFPLFTYMLVLIFQSLDAINQELIENLDAQKADLIRLNGIKDRIFSVISHDLRTPFNGLIGVLELIEENNGRFDEKHRKKIFSELLDSSRGTNLMLENLLIWARSEVGQSGSDTGHCHLASLCDETCLPYRQIARKKGVEIEVIVDDAIEFSGDVVSLKIALSNLLSNAVKFSLPGSSVSLIASRQAGSLLISVQDTGVGMSREQIDKMLDPNEVRTTYGTGNEKGSGLGMKICQQLMKQCGGTLQVVSMPGKGSTITLCIPSADGQQQ